MSGAGRAWLSCGLLMALAVAVRALMLPYPSLDADMAMTGLMARHVLEGELPLFFWGQPYCGAIEAYLTAPIFALFGSSRITLCASVALISLALVGLAFAAARDMWGQRAGLLAMLLAALPPSYFLVHNILPRAAYIEIPTLSLLLGWLAWRLGKSRGPSWEYLVFGLAAGLGFWTHFLIAYALLASALYLVLADWRVLIRKHLPIMLAGFFIGSLPLWIFNLEEPFATFLYLTRPKFHVTAWQAFSQIMVDGASGVLASWAVDRSLPSGFKFVYYGAGVLGLAWLAWLVWQRRKAFLGLVRFSARRADGSEVWLLMLLAALGVTVLSGESASYTLRHLVPVYAALIPLGAYLLDRLWQRGFKALGWGLLALILVCNLAGLYQAANIFHPERYTVSQAEERLNHVLTQSMLAKGVRHAYTYFYWDAYIFNFDAAEKVILDSPTHSHFPKYMRAILTDPSGGFAVHYDSGPYENPLRAAGAEYKRFQAGSDADPYFCLYGVRPPAHGLAEVSKDTWQIKARPHPQLAGLAMDNAVTVWGFKGPQKQTPQLELDLGRVEEELCLMRLLPGRASESAAHLALETSIDGETWTPAQALNGYRWPVFRAGKRFILNSAAPRQDLYFTPRAVRFLRLTIKNPKPDKPWSLAEISLYKAKQEQAKLNSAEVITAARSLGLKTLYAEQILAAKLPVDLAVHHALCPGPAKWPHELAPQIVLPRDLAGVGLAVETHQAPALAGFLKDHGFAWQEKAAGGYRIFHGLKRLSLIDGVLPEVAQARSSSRDEAKACDHDPSSRWSTGRPRQAGDFLELRLAQPISLSGLVLDSAASPLDLPKGLILELSLDCQSWHPVKATQLSTGPLVFTGDRMLASFVPGHRVLRFPAQKVAGLRLISPQGDKVFYFSVHGLRLILAKHPG